jgi:hypothetical protein
MAAATCVPAWMPAHVSWVVKPPVRPLQAIAFHRQRLIHAPLSRLATMDTVPFCQTWKQRRT